MMRSHRGKVAKANSTGSSCGCCHIFRVPTVEDQHWYKITAAVKEEGADGGEPTPIEVYVYGEIGGWGITANQFIQDLKAVDDGVSPVVVAFNTNGGDLFEGLAIHNALSRLGERCTGRVDALAASRWQRSGMRRTSGGDGI